jgi:hypothetical protein
MILVLEQLTQDPITVHSGNPCFQIRSFPVFQPRHFVPYPQVRNVSRGDDSS